MVEQARRLAQADDLPAMRTLARELRRRNEFHAGDRWLADIVAALEEVYDEAFPVTDPTDPADLLDAPWPTASRAAPLAAMMDQPWPRVSLLVQPAIAAGDVRLLRLLLRNPFDRLPREALVQILEALYAANGLDAESVEQAFSVDPFLGYGVLGRSPSAEAVTSPPATCAPAVRNHMDEYVWRLTGPDSPVDWDQLPKAPPPRGLRFVLRALHWSGDDRVAAHLGGAELTDAERDELVGYLRGRPEQEQRRAFDLRRPAGDAELLLPLLGLPGGESLLRLARASVTGDVVRQDRSAILAAAAEAGPDGARRVLELYPSELVSAALGWNRTAVEKRVKHHAQRGIAAYGLLPLVDGESVLDRYLVLREAAKRGAKFGPERRLNHAAAVAVALDHLAQVAGLPDASRLEWDCEARIAAEVPTDWRLGEYTVTVRLNDVDPVIVASRAGTDLKSIPPSVRAHPGYPEVREQQDRLREQARRMRTGLIERLVATGGTLDADEMVRLRSLPTGAAMLPALIWQDRTGAIGLLDQVDTTGPVTAIHPFMLYERHLLAEWQAEIVRRRIRQPVKQAFRELYLLTPAERAAGDVSSRFAGHQINGKVAAQLMSGRGWMIDREYAEYQATRPAGGSLTAALHCEFDHYFGLGDVLIGDLRFLAAGSAVPLADVPPVALSEVMRDLDLVVSVAGTDPGGYTSPLHAASRAQLLAALIEDLGLDRVSVRGTSAVVRGSRATYRVHLNSGSIHVEPGGYLCIVPAAFGTTAHRNLFLPFADEDRMTSVILSKILLLAEDEKITDRTILAQLKRPD
jgi:hypothetical protein